MNPNTSFQRDVVRQHLHQLLTRRGRDPAKVGHVVNQLMRKFITDDLFHVRYSFTGARLSPAQLEKVLDNISRQGPDYLNRILAMAVEIGELRLAGE